MTRSQDEFRLTCVMADYLRACWPPHLPWSHFPSGENRSAITGARLKRMGTAKGWPDFLLNLPNGRIGYVEVKTEKGSLRREQREFRDKVTANGAKWALCRSLADLEGICGLWLAGSPHALRGRAQ